MENGIAVLHVVGPGRKLKCLGSLIELREVGLSP